MNYEEVHPTAAPHPDQVIGHVRFDWPGADHLISLRCASLLCSLRCSVCHYFIYFLNCVCVISFWQIVYLLKIYSCLQGMNKLKQSLGAKLPLFRRLCKNTRFMLRKYIRFNPGGI